MNAVEWNRDLTRPVAEIRAREQGQTDKPDRGNGTVSLPEMRRGGIGLCVATLIARYVERVRFADALTIDRTAEGRHASIGYLLQLDVRENLTDVMETLTSVDGILRVAIRDEPITPSS